MSRLNIFKKGWIDMVFEGRNKAYGAYQLRSENPKTTTRALFLGIVLFGSAVSAPLIMRFISENIGVEKKENMDKVIETALLPPPPKDEILPPPPPPEPPKSVNDQVKFPPPKVVDKKLVRDEDPPTVKDLETADPGQKNVKGDKEAGDILIDKPAGDGPKNSDIVDDGNKVFFTVEVPPEFPGGMAGFNKYVQKNFRAPDVDEGVKTLRVIVGFVVERDGSLTDIKVLRDPGYGMGKEAIRMLQNAPKWKAGVQNGRAVRVAYNLPITIQVGE
ncbi:MULTISPECIES: energy transducer TonB [Flavobacterium]|uniref:energy transducer TonB n=1 Tax=Flavobacterium TaxID=237 RepID=UPI00086B12E9|nr:MULTISPECIES: energy transducer TonB [Flavobacterium]MBN9284386.1 energy transducer TonB [Flavobacterium sp.]ODS81689.1 MAG: energy transducer TonB [Chryseobacterium sp. SCN 40-13]OJV72922.1 MAG: energy transducer TonB [Flavobacterium sp. 40-81]